MYSLRWMLLFALVASSSDAQAQTAPTKRPLWLPLTAVPSVSLRMRPQIAVANQSGAPLARPPVPTPTSVAPASAQNLDMAPPTIFASFTVGFGIDGAASSNRNNFDARPVDLPTVRGIGFGNAHVGTAGFVVKSLSTFLSMEGRAAPDLAAIPIADARGDKSDVQIRSGWGEIKKISDSPLLAPLRVRLGRHWTHGVWPIHMDGSSIYWDTPVLQGTLSVGTLVLDFANQGVIDRSLRGIASFELRADIERWTKRRVQLQIELSTLRVIGISHALLSANYRPTPLVKLAATFRTLQARMVQQTVTARVQINSTSHAELEATHHSNDDWQWDPLTVNTSRDGARRYLELGAVTPMLSVIARGGTVIANNFDVFVRAAVAIDSSDIANQNSFRTSFIELGGGTELRLRRTIALFASGIFRDLARTPVPSQIDESANNSIRTPQPIVNSGHLGEQSILEGGGGLRLSLGARLFSTTVEGYLRRTRFANTYLLDGKNEGEEPILLATVVGGGRVSADASISSKLRVRVWYELSTAIRRIPEISGWKSLRLVLEGSF
jgi:hypothetical protein